MRRIALLGLLLTLSGCTGFGEFLSHTFSPPPINPNLPLADSENLRHALGQPIEFTPMGTEPGNVWPGPEGPEPTLSDVAKQEGGNIGAPSSTVPGATPGLPAGRQPRPTTRGSSTPPGSVQDGLEPLPNGGVLPQPQSSVPSAGPQGPVVLTPQGPAVETGGTSGYRTLTTPQGPGAILVPNGNGTSTIINPNGTVQTVPTPRR